MKKNYQIGSFAQLLTGSLVAQLITILVSPVSTRLFSKEILGVYTLVLTVVSIFGPVLCGRYDMSIITVRTKDEENNLVVGCTIIGLIFSLLISVTYFFVMGEEIAKTGVEKLIISSFLFLLLLTTALINILTAYNNKYKEYKLISVVYVKRTLMQNLLLVGTGVMKLGVIGLLFSQVSGLFIGVKEQSKSLRRKNNLKESISCDSMKQVLKQERNQPLFSMPATVLNASSYSIINFFITGLYGLSVFGLYSMSFRVLGIPLTLISTNLSRVYFQSASELKQEKGSYRKLLVKYSIFVSLISLVMVVFLIVFAPQVFRIVFGDGWEVAGQYVQILAPMYGIRLVVSSVSCSLIISRKQTFELYLQALFIIVSSISYLLARVLHYDEYIFLMMISVSFSIVYIIYFIVIYIFSGREDN